MKKIFFFNSFICLTLHKLEFVVKMVLVYIFDLFKDNLFAFLRGHIIARNYFLNHELFIIYEKKLLFKKPFFTSHASARANPPPINNKTPHGNFFSTVGQSKIAGTDLRGRLSPGKA